MICPQCGNPWDASKNYCPQCGFSGHPIARPEHLAYSQTARRNTQQAGGPFNSMSSAFMPPHDSSQFSQFSPSRPEQYTAFFPEEEMSPRPSGGLPYTSGNTRASASAQQSDRVSGVRPSLPGLLLRGGRYRLQELLERQDWLSGVFEAVWIGYDSLRSAQVMICEVVTPENTSPMARSMLHAATLALLAVGRHPQIMTLWDAFSDQGRSFFVSEFISGESLMMRLRRRGGPLPEQDVIDLCLQMCDILELLSHQTPPLVHGLIRPEHIYLVRGRASRYMLGNFSVILAGGATQFVVGMDRAHISPYANPEFTREPITGSSDLYSLLATAYYILTRNTPVSLGGVIPHAQQFNPAVSYEFNAILAKGLSPLPGQRYQHPAELRQDLLSLRSVSGNLVARDISVSLPGFQSGADFSSVSGGPGAAQPFPIKMPMLEEEDEREVFLLPRPEELPPMREGRDGLSATIIFAVVLIFLALVAAASNFLG